MKVYVHKDGKQYGPYTVEQLRHYVRQGNFTTADHACHDGQNWVTIADVPGFAEATRPTAVPSPTAPRQDQVVQEKAVDQQPSSTDASNPASKKKKIILWASIGGVAALLVTGLLIWLPGNGGDSTGDKTGAKAQAPEEKIAGSDGKTLAEFLPGKKIYFWSPPPGESVQKNKRPNSVLQFGKDGPWDMGIVFSEKEVFPLSELPEALAKQAYAVNGLQVELSGEMMTGTIAFSSPNPRKGEEMVLGDEKGNESVVTISWIAEAGSPLPDAHQFDSEEGPDATVGDTGQSQRPKPTAKDKPNKVSIFDATVLGWISVVQQQVDAGSDLNKVMEGTTALDLAIEEKQTEIAALLRKHGAKTGKEMQAEKFRLAKERNATELFLDYDHITDLKPLAGLTDLTSLSLAGNQITDLKPLAGLTKFEKLDLGSNKISDLSPLKGLANLEKLTLSHNQITNISPLKGLTKLEFLSLSDNKIIDISPLAGLTDLTSLSLADNQITDVAPLAGLTNLRSLYLSKNQMIDLTSLAELSKLRRIGLEGNPITEEQKEMLKKALPNCTIRF